MKAIHHYILTAILLLSMSGVGNLAVSAAPAPAQEMSAAQKKKAAEKKKKAAEKQKAADKKRKEAEKKRAAAQKAAAKKQAASQKAAEANEKAAATAQKAAEKKQAAQEAATQKAEEERIAAEEKQLADWKKYQEELGKEKTPVVSYFNLGLRAGYAAMMDRIPAQTDGQLWGAATLNGKNTLQQLKGGPGAGIGLNYGLEYKHLLFETGLDFRYLRSTSAYGFTMSRVDQTYGATYTYLFDNMQETRNLMQVGIPVMLGAQFNRFYFLLGAKAGYSLWGNYSMKGQYDITVNDPKLLEPYGMGIHEVPAPANRKLTFKQPEVSLCAELGIDLDEWLQAQPDKKKARVKAGQREPFSKEYVHYRVGFFAEYGLLNTNGMAAAQPMAFQSDATLPAASNSMLSVEGTKMNNLFVGAKFTIQFEIPGKAGSVHKSVPTPPCYLNVRVLDKETGEPVSAARVSILSIGKNSKPRQSGLADGQYAGKFALGDYKITVSGLPVDGKKVTKAYLSDSLLFTASEPGSHDTLVLFLEKRPEPVEIIDTIPEVKPGRVFVLKNLFFATGKTTILEASEPALETLYEYMTDEQNTTRRIRIIGHTDNVGRDAANQKLSEGRANAVRDALIQKGIEPSRIEAEGRGESEPIDTNDTEEGRQNNRRVEILILE